MAYYSLINYRKVRSCRRQTKISDTFLRCRLLWGIIIISQILTPPTPTLAEDDGTSINRSRDNSISGKFFEYMNNLRSASPSNSESSLEPSSTSAKNSSTTSSFRTLFRDSSWQEAYQKFLNQVKKVRGMLSRNNSSGEMETQTDSSIIYNSTENGGLSSNRSGRINGPYSWGWPQWMSSTPLTSTPSDPSSGSGARTPLNRIFFGPFDNGRNNIPTTGYNPSSTGYYPPPPPAGPGSSLFGPGSPSQTHYNYVYKYNPKTNSATDLEQHTTTTIYIICICLVIMLVGTILFAFVSKCQEASGRTVGGTTAPPVRSRRRRGQNGGATISNNNNNNNTSTSTESTFTTIGGRPEISIIMPSGDGPPAYPKVIFDPPPPSYDSLFPVELVVKQ